MTWHPWTTSDKSISGIFHIFCACHNVNDMHKKCTISHSLGTLQNLPSVQSLQGAVACGFLCCWSEACQGSLFYVWPSFQVLTCHLILWLGGYIPASRIVLGPQGYGCPVLQWEMIGNTPFNLFDLAKKGALITQHETAVGLIVIDIRR